MQLKVIATGSRGNCYVLESDNSALVIECGVPLAEVKKALDFNVLKISGLIVSHSHQDHCKYVKEYLAEGIPVYMSRDTMFQLDLLDSLVRIIEARKRFRIGVAEFSLLPFELVHDVTCLGFEITHRELGKAVFMTDTRYSPYAFDEVNHWIIECNHSRETIERKLFCSHIEPSLARRVTENHMSLETVQTLLAANDLTVTRNIVLIHGSEYNSDDELFKQIIKRFFHKQVHVAEKGMIIDFNLIQF